MYDTLIIGAGMSGLAAGIRLTHFGKRVCIVEQHSTIGGLNSFYRQRGRIFDVGLHAVTNYAPKGSHRGPFSRLLRQLRIAWDDWSLAPQIESAVMFPDVTLRFNNDFALLESEVRRHFPKQIDNFRRLVSQLIDYDNFGNNDEKHSARAVLGEIIDDPLLIEMIMCPILFYGGSREHDIDFDQFSIMFRAIFLEGFARPTAGIQLILKILLRRFKENGGELRLRSPVERIVVEGDVARKVVLESGEEIEARTILSSAGWTETMRLCSDEAAVELPQPGRLSFVETISILDRQPRSVGYDKTIVFFNDSETFNYEKPTDLADLHSGVICSPNNFSYSEPLSEGIIRICVLANYDRWAALNPAEYQLAKLRWYDRITASAVRFIPDFRRAAIDNDIFTPITIRRFTGHANGAVYGAPEKRRDGTTPLKNLFICGNDQGFVGIVGTLISGISIANKHLLK